MLDIEFIAQQLNILHRREINVEKIHKTNERATIL